MSEQQRGRVDDVAAIEHLVAQFFEAFTSGPGSAARLDVLRSICLPEAVIVRTCGSEPLAYDVESFIEPRAALLSGGSLVDFSEWPVAGQVETFGDIGHWWGSYAKQGVQDGVRFTGRGHKALVFVRTSAGWRISSAAWDDERDN